MDISKYKKENDDVSFVLVVIDIFSKFLKIEPLQYKKGQSVTAVFKHVLREGRRPTRLRSDKGQEFRSRAFNALSSEQKIDHLYAQNTEVKANYAKRVIKTIKAKLYRCITYEQSYCYVDKLKDFARNNNATFHRAICMPPVKVTKDKERDLWWKMYWPNKIPIIPKTKRVH